MRYIAMRLPLHRILAIVGLLALVGLLVGSAAPAYTANAKLFGQGPMRGSAVCTSRTGATGPYRVDIDINNAQPAQSVDVRINNTIVGQITTDSSGAGHLRVNNLAQPLNADDTVTVGMLTGVFYDTKIATQTYELRGVVTNIVGVKYVVRYREFYRSGVLERRWEVTITNAEPNQSVPTFVRGVFVRPLLPGSDGKAVLRMRTASFIDSGDNPAGWIPLPNTFPSLRSGEVVQVGTSYITMTPN
jgi:hypothetical protein